ncbi:MAG: hypothetical protein COT74_05850 [Bdellovibrionales bacterium CG10_big_fil_rev_8_21_14_0_10_45_34]|nr:MAG: hypothetical protein COT74_05850 [Bdellovibrionales bacterium CG10_big_fil_rev_8_21_14_0_10_45_34]
MKSLIQLGKQILNWQHIAVACFLVAAGVSNGVADVATFRSPKIIRLFDSWPLMIAKINGSREHARLDAIEFEYETVGTNLVVEMRLMDYTVPPERISDFADALKLSSTTSQSAAFGEFDILDSSLNPLPKRILFSNRFQFPVDEVGRNSYIMALEASRSSLDSETPKRELRKFLNDLSVRLAQGSSLAVFLATFTAAQLGGIDPASTSPLMAASALVYFLSYQSPNRHNEEITRIRRMRAFGPAFTLLDLLFSTETEITADSMAVHYNRGARGGLNLSTSEFFDLLNQTFEVLAGADGEFELSDTAEERDALISNIEKILESSDKHDAAGELRGKRYAGKICRIFGADRP